MYCSNCGKQIPDNTNYCNFCGTQQFAKNGVDFESTAEGNNKTKKDSNKSVNIIVALGIAVCVFLFGKFVIAPAMLSDYNNDPLKETSPSTETLKIENPAYDDVFDGTYIIHMQTFLNMETANFVTEFDDGMIFCSDYGYEDDIVKEMVETMYIPVSDYTESEKTNLQNTMKSNFEVCEAIDCCTVNYQMSANYFTVTMRCSDIDKEENYSALFEAGILDTNTYISMSATESQLLADGAIKK